MNMHEDSRGYITLIARPLSKSSNVASLPSLPSREDIPHASGEARLDKVSNDDDGDDGFDECQHRLVFRIHLSWLTAVKLFIKLI